jgi:hypothetical protein
VGRNAIVENAGLIGASRIMRKAGDMHGYILSAVLLLAVGAEPPVDRVPTPQIPPQRKVEPTKPEPRPTLKFEQLSFENEQLQRETKLFHDLAEERTAGGESQLYRSQGSAFQRQANGLTTPYPQYCAYWTSKPSARPSHYFAIWLEGPTVNGVERLNKLRVESRVNARNLWTATVDYSVSFQDGKPERNVSVTVEPSDDYVRRDPQSHARRLQLLSPTVSAVFKETRDLRYDFNSVLSSRPAFDHIVQALGSTPETLRDQVLAELEAFRRQTREQFESDLLSGGSLTLTDSRGATSAEPPRKDIALITELKAATKKALQDQAEQQIAAQETVVRENFREIHAVIQQALPLRDMVEELSRKE